MVEQGEKCPKCGIVAVKLIAIGDDGDGVKICRLCKKKIRKMIAKGFYKGVKEKLKLLDVEVQQMVLQKVLKISGFSIERLRAYAENHKLVSPVGSTEQQEKDFYVTELTKLNDGKDDVGGSVNASAYKGVNSCVCSKCGAIKAVRPDVYAKRIEKFGSEDNLKKGYLCMECRPKGV